MGRHHHTDSYLDANAAAALRERALRLCIGVTFVFAGLEALGGWWTGSLALTADAGHMLSDSAALFMAWAAAKLSQRPPDGRYSYGWRRAEVLAGLINAVLMLGIVAFLVPAALARFDAPREVHGASVMLIAAIGLVVNIIVFRLLHAADRGAINTRGALLHVLGDLLGSIAALASGLVILLTGWTPIDALLSLLIGALILISAVRLLLDVSKVLMESVPEGIDLAAVRTGLLNQPGITSVHDLHVWTLAGDQRLLSAHVGIASDAQWPEVLINTQRHLRDEFGINHATLQPESPAYDALLAAAGDERPLDDHAH